MKQWRRKTEKKKKEGRMKQRQKEGRHFYSRQKEGRQTLTEGKQKGEIEGSKDKGRQNEDRIVLI